MVAAPGDLETLVLRRIAGEPLETILGWVEFLGRRLVVAPGVFVPRRRSELLGRLASAEVDVLLELCAGVGPVAAVSRARDVHVADLSATALACARINAPYAQVHQGDLFAPVPGGLRGRVDVIAANAPYVPTGEIADLPREARDHEPRLALDGGEDGVDLHRRIAGQAPRWLSPGGTLLIETSPGQAPLTLEAIRSAGLVARLETDSEIGGCVAVGVRPTVERA